jgi:hypothetical protein
VTDTELIAGAKRGSPDAAEGPVSPILASRLALGLCVDG